MNTNKQQRVRSGQDTSTLKEHSTGVDGLQTQPALTRLLLLYIYIYIERERDEER